MSLDMLPLIIVLVTGFYLAWSIGANDVSNAMGTSVGSGALTLGKAVIIAGVLEFAGAFLVGGNVSHTMQSGIINPDFFSGDQTKLLYGMISALIATALWLQVASFFRWPVSTTHAIVGALIGFGAIVGGIEAVQWNEVAKIATGWIFSPALSALFAFLLFMTLQRRVLFAMSPIAAAKKLIPYLAALLFTTFIFSVLYDGLGRFQVDLKPLQLISITVGVALITYFISKLLVRDVKKAGGYTVTPKLAQNLYSINKAIKHLQRVKLSSKGERSEEASKMLKSMRSMAADLQKETGIHTRTSDYTTVEKMFAMLQILSAAYVAFGHGANDVANAIGPVAAALDIIKTGSLSLTTRVPTYLLALGGVGIVVGLATWGWRVIETVGKKITELTPTRGFCAEFGAAITILLASKLGLPISTTHCVVGAVLGVGLARGIAALNLRVLKDIVLSWVITIPASACSAILIYTILKLVF